MTIHPLSEVQSTNIGEGTTVWQFCVILYGAKIGKNCNINCHVFIENDVIIGDNVFIGPNATFTNDLRPRSKNYPKHPLKTTIKRGASIGANATILPGITIGENAMIGAGSVIINDVPPNTVWAGNPGRQIKQNK